MNIYYDMQNIDLSSWVENYKSKHKGVYPQSDDSKQWGRRYPSKRIVAQWEHLSFAIFAISDLKRQLKLLEMACDQVQTCLIFPLQWVCFPIKIAQNAH